jgi:hypothetical protein
MEQLEYSDGMNKSATTEGSFASLLAHHPDSGFNRESSPDQSSVDTKVMGSNDLPKRNREDEGT